MGRIVATELTVSSDGMSIPIDILNLFEIKYYVWAHYSWTVTERNWIINQFK